MDDVFKAFPVLKGRVAWLKSEYMHGDFMQTSLITGNLYAVKFNPMFFRSLSVVKDAYAECVLNGWFPGGTDWKNLGVHELGHVLHGLAAEKSVGGYADARAWVNDWNSSRFPKQIVSEAWERVKGLYPSGAKEELGRLYISDYSGDPLSPVDETVAEAFSDVFSNGLGAKAFSVEIIKLLLEALR